MGFRKAFDTILSKLGVPPKFLSVLQQLHDGMQTTVVAGELQDQLWSEAKLCLGSVLFSLLHSAINFLFPLNTGHKVVHLEYCLDGSLLNIV